MSNKRLDDFNQKFVYIDTNPENIIHAKKNALFIRNQKNFYVNHSGVVDGKWEKLNYKTVIIPHPPANKLIKYKKEFELWLKTTDGFYDEFKKLLPKTGWKFLNNQNIFVGASIKKLNWIFPVPVSSNDTIGNNNSRSYDENYFYAKISGKWYRTPIAVYNYIPSEGPDNPNLSTSLPFVDAPRFKPLPSSSNSPSQGGLTSDQSYDTEYFYIKPSIWKRSLLNIYYNTNKMSRF
jgi:hypothetical protein